MKTHVLHIDSDEEFALLGIVSTSSLVKLAWELSTVFKIELARTKDMAHSRNREVSEFPCLTYSDIDNDRYIGLLRNRGSHFVLLPAYRQMDYIVIERKGHSDYLMNVLDLQKSKCVQFCSELKAENKLLESLQLFES